MSKKVLFYEYFPSDFTDYSIVMEQSKHVAYAYLLNFQKIISDVWLYNVSETPQTADWSNGKSLPFKNPITFLKELKLPIPATDVRDIIIVWAKAEDLVCANIYLRDHLLAQLRSNERIGYSTLVSIDGPLAKVLK